MKKHLLLGVALIGMLFTGCIDDFESASVTAVRDAKAEQLKTMADLDKANAEAALIMANAEKLAKEAEAAYNLAQAEYLKAQSAYILAKTEWEKAANDAELELKRIQMEQAQVALEQAKVALEQAQAYLKKLLAQLDAEIEAALAKYKYDTLFYQNLYDTLAEQIANAADEKAKAEAQEKAAKLLSLIQTYDRCAKNLINAKYNLSQDNLQLVNYQTLLAGLDYEAAPAAINAEIQKLQNKNADLEVQISEQQAIIDTYEEYAGTVITQDMVTAAYEAMKSASAAYDETGKIVNATNEAYNAANEQRANWYNEYVGTNINRSYYYSWENEKTERWDSYSVNIQRVGQSNANAPAEVRNNYCVVITKNEGSAYYGYWDEDGNYQYEYAPGVSTTTYYPLFKSMDWAEDVKTTDLGDYIYYDTYSSYYDLINDGSALDEIINLAQKQFDVDNDPEYIAKLTEEAATAKSDRDKAQAAFDKAAEALVAEQDTLATAQTTYEAAKKAYDDAVAAQNDAIAEGEDDAEVLAALQEAVDDALTDRTEASEALTKANNDVNVAQLDKTKALKSLDNAISYYNNKQRQLNQAELDKENGASNLASLKENFANVVEYGKAMPETLKTYNEASKAYAEARVANNEAYTAFDKARTEFYNIEYRVGQTIGGDWYYQQFIQAAEIQINNLKSQIKANNARIETLQGQLDGCNDDLDASAKFYEEQIAFYTKEIELDTVTLNTAQQLFDIAKAELEEALGTEVQ